MTLALNKWNLEKLRKEFPALHRTYNNKPIVYFDGPGGTQMYSHSIKLMMDYIKQGMANRHGHSSTSIATENILKQAREKMAELLNVKNNEVFFGPNMTTLTYSLARMFSRNWKRGDNIVITEMDHHANIDPWVQVAEEKGVKVNTIEINLNTLELDPINIDEIINPKTKVVCLGLASNAIGTINDLDIFIKMAKRVNALVIVDAVQAVPHVRVDNEKLGADVILASGYKFFGPHVGIGAIKEELFKSYKPYKLSPATNEVPSLMELGTQNHEGIAGLIGAVSFFTSFGNGKNPKEKIEETYKIVEKHENNLADFLREELAKIDQIKLFQPNPPTKSTPIISFIVTNNHSYEISKYLAQKHSIFVADGDFYAESLANKLGVNKNGGWVRIGISAYNTMEECVRLVNGIKDYLQTPK